MLLILPSRRDRRKEINPPGQKNRLTAVVAAQIVERLAHNRHIRRQRQRQRLPLPLAGPGRQRMRQRPVERRIVRLLAPRRCLVAGRAAWSAAWLKRSQPVDELRRQIGGGEVSLEGGANAIADAEAERLSAR